MIIGLCYDLRSAYLALGYGEEETAEFDRESTIDAIAGALTRLGHEVDRIGHARELMARLLAGDRWDLVFNIAEGLHGIGREAQVPCILDVYGIPYTFSDPMVLALSLHKGMTKRILRDAGLPTPDFAVITDLADLDGLALEFPLFAKPVAEGTGKGIDGGSVMTDPVALRDRCALLLARYRQPVLVERYLPGREFTVGIVGTGGQSEVIGTLEVVVRDATTVAYGYDTKERCEDLVDYVPVSADGDPTILACEAVALAAWQLLGGRDAGRIDLRADADGIPHVLELNPLAGLHPEHSDLPMVCTAVGLTYDQLIARIVASAAERIGEVIGHEGVDPARPDLAASGA
jgi:D-alanine-D-alanine ligase